MFKYNIKQGFTLAEVLITLAIIGVIATMTIPALTKSINDAEKKVALKEAFRILNTTVSAISGNNGGTIKTNCGNLDNDCFMNSFLPYLRYSKTCHTGSSLGNCFDSSYKLLNGALSSSQGQNWAGVVLNNNMSIMFREHVGTCDASIECMKCGWIGIDVNGFKGPNTWGKDFFVFGINDNKVIPLGKPTTVSPYSECSPDGSGQAGWGLGCTYDALYGN